MLIIQYSYGVLLLLKKEGRKTEEGGRRGKRVRECEERGYRGEKMAEGKGKGKEKRRGRSK